MSTGCSVPGCTRDVLARRLCRMHYSRWRRGVPVDQPRVGDPSGYGQWGVMDRGEHDVLCHECGQRYASVGSHAYAAHGITAREYRLRYGIPSTTPLVSLAVSRAHSRRATAQVGTPAWGRLEAARDPQAASDARDHTAFRRIGLEDVARDNGSATTSRRRCAWCGQGYRGRRRTCSSECLHEIRSWAATQQAIRRRESSPAISPTDINLLGSDRQAETVRRLQSAGISSRDIGIAIGRSPSWMAAHYPRPRGHRRALTTALA